MVFLGSTSFSMNIPGYSVFLEEIIYPDVVCVRVLVRNQLLP